MIQMHSVQRLVLVFCISGGSSLSMRSQKSPYLVVSHATLQLTGRCHPWRRSANYPNPRRSFVTVLEGCFQAKQFDEKLATLLGWST